MVDRLTYEAFKLYAAKGERNTAERLSSLNDAEAELYTFIKAQPNKNRLEQEKIPQYYIDQELQKIIP
jgi:hypothetical protein